MKEIFLLKLGEIVLKGANKRQFESRLRQNVRRRMKKYGNFDVYLMQSTVYVEPMDDECDVDGAWECCRSIFGVVSLCRCRPCEKNLDAISRPLRTIWATIWTAPVPSRWSPSAPTSGSP